MAYRCIIGTAEGFGKQQFAKLGRFRKNLFVETYGWNLKVRDGEEFDEFDTSAVVYAATFSDDDVVAMFRLTRTDRPNLSRIVFGNLARVTTFPSSPDVWEVSRFGALTSQGSELNHALMLHFAKTIGAKSLVAVTDLVYERVLRRFGIRTQRFGPPATIGIDRSGRELMGVAGEIVISQQSGTRYRRLLALASKLEIQDVSHVFRRQLIPA